MDGSALEDCKQEPWPLLRSVGRADIGRWVIRRALTPVICGALLGLISSFALTRLLQGLLYGVQPNDPLTLAVGTLVLLLSALAAAYLPARRAASVDPVDTLKG